MLLLPPFFRRGIEGVEKLTTNPLSPPLKKGEARARAIHRGYTKEKVK